MAEKKSFEEALARLEEIANQLEGGDLALDDAITAFEEGISLVRLCRRLLRQAERKIQRLSKMALDAAGPGGPGGS
jgi:exodeoxyribonuclease VII small subunit